MPIAHLTDRAVVTVAGPDAGPFLQNLITADLDALGKGEAKPAALLSPQGKILFDFLVMRRGDGFALDLRADADDDFVRRLTLYRLRARVEISKSDQGLVAVEWQAESARLESGSASSRDDSGFADRRFHPPAGVLRHYGVAAPAATASTDDWHAFRIAQGVPESGQDFELGEAFPHDALLDQLGGVGFRKGCYVGQEVVSRMQHRGTARRRFLIASSGAVLPQPGASITAGGKPVGTLGSVAGGKGLALVRIDRVKDAMDAGLPILAGEAALDLAIPSWASFGFPAEAAAADEA